MRKSTFVCIASAACLALSAPALAKTTTWYVAQNAKTMNCIVTPTKPNGTSYTMVGTMTFTGVSTATKDMRSEDACKVVTKVAVKTTPKAPAGSSTAQPKVTTSPPASTPSATATGGLY